MFVFRVLLVFQLSKRDQLDEVLLSTSRRVAALVLALPKLCNVVCLRQLLGDWHFLAYSHQFSFDEVGVFVFFSCTHSNNENGRSQHRSMSSRLSINSFGILLWEVMYQMRRRVFERPTQRAPILFDTRTASSFRCLVRPAKSLVHPPIFNVIFKHDSSNWLQIPEDHVITTMQFEI
ncbi:hypothetical protein BLNAU_21929 [Blattamonas nauphoetae]|uniref:Secreted protein n=1 Tax=Blattamonas nauphoetae TaxID=2049346 RepID=A0ABQ9WUI6_9EUKA|nr:hypothetical protein BLNAU_21929 [Blattamonas nauphoetae]